jgi:hypothetical protein
VAVDSDLHHWEAVRACFQDQVYVDYTSLNGGSAATMAADDLIAGWQGVLSGFAVTQHIVSNHRIIVDGDHATCTAYVHATHYLPTAFGSPLWKVAGYYTYQLARTDRTWQITAMTFTATWGEGNQQLPSLATERAKG